MHVAVVLDACTPETIHELAADPVYPTVTIKFLSEPRATFAGAPVEVSGELEDVLRLVHDNWAQGDLADLAANMELPEPIVRAACVHYGIEVNG